MKHVKGWFSLDLFLHETTWSCYVLGVSFLIIGISLITQPERWMNTTVYQNFFKLIPTQKWGWLYTVIGAGLILGAMTIRRTRWPAVYFITLAQALTTVWTIGTLLRWLTTNNTSPIAVITFALFQLCLFRALILVDLGRIQGLRR